MLRSDVEAKCEERKHRRHAGVMSFLVEDKVTGKRWDLRQRV